MTDDPTHGLSVQHADALWDAVAIPGPRPSTFPAQHERVCRAVAGILAEVTAVPEEPTADRAAYLAAADRLDAAAAREDALSSSDYDQEAYAAKRLREEATELRRTADEPEPTPLRWGLDDILHGDDDTTTVMLSGPAGEPYRLELDPERAAALRDSLPGPDQEA